MGKANNNYGAMNINKNQKNGPNKVQANNSLFMNKKLDLSARIKEMEAAKSKKDSVEDMFRELEAKTRDIPKNEIPQNKINLLNVPIPDRYFNGADIDRQAKLDREKEKIQRRNAKQIAEEERKRIEAANSSSVDTVLES